MPANRAIRASDHDREHLVEILRSQYAEGRLTLAEFDDRMATAYEAKTWGDLLDLTSDLPAEVRLGTDLTTRSHGAADKPPLDQQPRSSMLRFAPLVPLLLGGIFLASIGWGGAGYAGHHHPYVAILPVWPLLVVLLIFFRRGARRGGPFR